MVQAAYLMHRIEHAGGNARAKNRCDYVIRPARDVKLSLNNIYDPVCKLEHDNISPCQNVRFSTDGKNGRADSRQGKLLDSGAKLGRGTRHPIDGAGALVLNDRMPTIAPDLQQSLCTVTPHARQQHADYPLAKGRGGLKQRVNGGAMPG